MISSKYEDKLPLMIEVVIIEDNTTIRYPISPEYRNKVEYEVRCSDSELCGYEVCYGDFVHTFKHRGRYILSFRGDLRGLCIFDNDVCIGDMGDEWVNIMGPTFDDMRSFVIEVEVLKDNATLRYKTAPKGFVYEGDEVSDDVCYEALCSDSETGIYEAFEEDFVHTFKRKGRYKISFRGKLFGLYIRDCADAYYLVDVCQWGNIEWMDMRAMFKGCTRFNISATDSPDLSQVTSLSEMFRDAESMNAPLEKWDVSNVTNMSGMFLGAKAFNQPIEKWDVSNVFDMRDMFLGAKAFNQSLEKWDVSNVTDMEGMFDGAEAFNQPLEKWDVSHVTDMSAMFWGALSFNQPLEKWDVSHVTNTRSMFCEALLFNQPLEKWDVSHVTDMSAMFWGAKAFNQPIEKWDVSNVTDMSWMLYGLSSFNQPLEKWDVSNVLEMRGMFEGAEAFNQPLEKWDVSHVTDMADMFKGASSFNQSLEKWDVLNVTNMSEMFDGAEALVHKPSWYEE